MWEGTTLTPTVILVSEKEGKSLQKRGNGKVCPVTARRGLHSELHTRSALSVVIGMTWQSMGLSARSGHRRTSSGFVSVQTGTAQSRHDLVRALGLKFGTQETCVVLHFSVSKYNMPQKNSWAVHCYLAQFHHSSFGRESLLHAQASFRGKFLLHVPCYL